MESELEKTQLEIAKLQLEQERRKLARMDRRQEAVGALGQGAVAAGGAAWWFAKAALVAGASFTFSAVVFAAMLPLFMKPQTAGDGAYLWAVGALVGEYTWLYLLIVLAATIWCTVSAMRGMRK